MERRVERRVPVDGILAGREEERAARIDRQLPCRLRELCGSMLTGDSAGEVEWSTAAVSGIVGGETANLVVMDPLELVMSEGDSEVRSSPSGLGDTVE